MDGISIVLIGTYYRVNITDNQGRNLDHECGSVIWAIGAPGSTGPTNNFHYQMVSWDDHWTMEKYYHTKTSNGEHATPPRSLPGELNNVGKHGYSKK